MEAREVCSWAAIAPDVPEGVLTGQQRLCERDCWGAHGAEYTLTSLPPLACKLGCGTVVCTFQLEGRGGDCGSYTLPALQPGAPYLLLQPERAGRRSVKTQPARVLFSPLPDCWTPQIMLQPTHRMEKPRGLTQACVALSNAASPQSPLRLLRLHPTACHAHSHPPLPWTPPSCCSPLISAGPPSPPPRPPPPSSSPPPAAWRSWRRTCSAAVRRLQAAKEKGHVASRPA